MIATYGCIDGTEDVKVAAFQRIGKHILLIQTAIVKNRMYFVFKLLVAIDSKSIHFLFSVIFVLEFLITVLLA